LRQLNQPLIIVNHRLVALEQARGVITDARERAELFGHEAAREQPPHSQAQRIYEHPHRAAVSIYQDVLHAMVYALGLDKGDESAPRSLELSGHHHDRPAPVRHGYLGLQPDEPAQEPIED
jgi:hypothetical protein